MLFVRSASFEPLPTQSSVKFTSNAGLTVKKKSDPKSKYLNGPIARRVGRRKVISLFNKVVY